MQKVAFVTNIIPRYRYPVYEFLHRAAKFRLGIFTTVPLSGSCRDAVATLPVKYSASLNFLSTTQHRMSGASQREPISVPLGLALDLIKFHPDVIVAGDLGLRSLVCWIVAKVLNAKFVLSSEEIASSARGRSPLQHGLRRFLIRRADALLAWGEPAKRYLMTFNVPATRIFTCAQAVDNEYWIRLSRQHERSHERSKRGLEGVVFLLVGRALRRKGFQRFLEAWNRLPVEQSSRTCAVVVGDGDYLAELKSQTAAYGLKNVIFMGARTPEELAQLYCAADIFVLPSLEDVWGMVVNEALCFGLPIVASVYAGASQGLIAGSSLGAVFDPNDIEGFAKILGSLVEAPPASSVAACHAVLEGVTFDKSWTAIQRMIDGLPVTGNVNG